MAASDYMPHPPVTACVFAGVHRWKAERPLLGDRLQSLTNVHLERHVGPRPFSAVRATATLSRKLMGWTPPDGIDVPEWRC